MKRAPVVWVVSTPGGRPHAILAPNGARAAMLGTTAVCGWTPARSGRKHWLRWVGQPGWEAMAKHRTCVKLAAGRAEVVA